MRNLKIQNFGKKEISKIGKKIKLGDKNQNWKKIEIGKKS